MPVVIPTGHLSLYGKTYRLVCFTVCADREFSQKVHGVASHTTVAAMLHQLPVTFARECTAGEWAP